jgi:hypothetical protein
MEHLMLSPALSRSSSIFPILAAPFRFVHTGLTACVFARQAQA